MIPGSPDALDTVVVVADVAHSVDRLAAAAPLDPSCSSDCWFCLPSCCAALAIHPPILRAASVIDCVQVPARAVILVAKLALIGHLVVDAAAFDCRCC